MRSILQAGMRASAKVNCNFLVREDPCSGLKLLTSILMEIGTLGHTLSNQKEYFLLQICYPRGDVPPFENRHFQIRHARMAANWSVRNFCLHPVVLENRQRRFSVYTSWNMHRPGNRAVNCKCFLQNGLLKFFWKEKYTLLEKAVFSLYIT